MPFTPQRCHSTGGLGGGGGVGGEELECRRVCVCVSGWRGGRSLARLSGVIDASLCLLTW